KLLRLLPGMQPSRAPFLARSPDLEAAAEGEPAVFIGVGKPIPVPLDTIRAALDLVVAGTFAAGHVPHSKVTADLLAERGIRMIVILRDPRDVAVSHARFISES